MGGWVGLFAGNWSKSPLECLVLPGEKTLGPVPAAAWIDPATWEWCAVPCPGKVMTTSSVQQLTSATSVQSVCWLWGVLYRRPVDIDSVMTVFDIGSGRLTFSNVFLVSLSLFHWSTASGDKHVSLSGRLYVMRWRLLEHARDQVARLCDYDRPPYSLPQHGYLFIGLILN